MTFNNETNSGNGNGYHTGSNNSNSIIIYDCSVCSLPIRDQSVFKVNENYFHAVCLNCSKCRIKLLDKCYARDGSVYCKEDFFKKFGTRCASCGHNIPPSESVRRANDFVYHLQCFACLICRHQLNTGDEFYLIDDQKLVCKFDYDTLKNKDFDDTNKRPRTTITQTQLEVLKRAYNISQKPARHIRESLAADTGLDMRVVQVWFQNRRAKEKRLKKDPNKRWSNVMRTKRINQRKTKRTQKQSIHEEEEDSSNEGDKIASYDELSAHDSDDSLSHVHHINSIYSGIHPASNELLPFASFYTESNGLRGESSGLLLTRSFSSSSSIIVINDNHESPPELDCNTFTSIRNDNNVEHEHQHWLDNQSINQQQ